LACVLARELDIRVVGAAAVRETERLAPQVVIMDISMPMLNGIEATRAICGKAPGTGTSSCSRCTARHRGSSDAGDVRRPARDQLA